MADSEGSSHAPLKLTMRFVLNVLLVFAMSSYLSDYFLLDGGFRAYIIVGALITLMNLFFRPIINLLTLPLKLVATIVAVIIANGIFMYVVELITERMDPSLVSFSIFGGPWGWIVVAMCFGLANWVMKEMFT